MESGAFREVGVTGSLRRLERAQPGALNPADDRVADRFGEVADRREVAEVVVLHPGGHGRVELDQALHRRPARRGGERDVEIGVDRLGHRRSSVDSSTP